MPCPPPAPAVLICAPPPCCPAIHRKGCLSAGGKDCSSHGRSFTTLKLPLSPVAVQGPRGLGGSVATVVRQSGVGDRLWVTRMWISQPRVLYL